MTIASLAFVKVSTLGRLLNINILTNH